MEIATSFKLLESSTYRCLQKMAKAAGLPANVKKSCLIELIQAKKYKSQSELDTLIDDVKLQRAHWAVKRAAAKHKNGVQGSEISSTSRSPLLRRTPKRRKSLHFRYSPELNVIKYKSRQAIATNAPSYIYRPISISPKIRPNIKPHTITSKMFEYQNNMKVFKYRSPRNKRYLRPQNGTSPRSNVRILRGNGRRQESNTSNGNATGNNMDIISYDGQNKFCVTIYGKNKPNTEENTRQTIQTTPKSTRKRTISGISPLNMPELNAQEMSTSNDNNSSEMAVQEMFSSGLAIEVTCTNEYMLPEGDLQHNVNFPNLSAVEHTTQSSIQIEDSRPAVVMSVAEAQRLPRIVDVFTKLGDPDARLRRPIYVQVDDGSQGAEPFSLIPSRAGTSSSCLLEGLYNFRNSQLTNQPLPRIPTTDTKCVYSTTTIVTPMAHPPAALVRNEYNLASLQRHDPHEYFGGNAGVPAICECFTYDVGDGGQDFTCREVMPRSPPDANEAIPEMADAMEIISQDGDYMERLGMDGRVQCVLCEWKGPRFMLEYHLRQEHSSQIEKQVGSCWNVSFPLRNLGEGGWVSSLAEHQSALFVLSAKHLRPYGLMACFHALHLDDVQNVPKVKITVFNQVTGEPIVWEGNVEQLPEAMPQSFEENFMNLPLSKLDVLPRDDMLLNRELHPDTPDETLQGRSDLQDIQIIFFVELYQ